MVRILDNYLGSTSSKEAYALIHELEHVDIYSNSWGPADDGEGFDELPKVVEEALELGVTTVSTLFKSCCRKLKPEFEINRHSGLVYMLC